MKPLSCVWILVACLAMPCACPALDVGMPSEESPGTGVMSKLDGPHRNSELPEHVAAEFGKVTLFADHDHKTENGVPLYLVNRGTETVSWHTYAGAPGIVLEQFDDASQRWRQAQSGMISMAMCADSYWTMHLLPGQHFKSVGYRPTKGREGKVRFSLGDHLVSNEAIGLWFEGDVARTGVDRIAFYEHPFASVLSNWHLHGEDPERASASRVLAELELMQVWEDGKVFRSFAKAFRAELLRHTTESGLSHEADLKAVDALIAHPQASAADPDRLFKRCIEVLNQLRGARHGSPEMEQEAAWSALNWLRMRPGYNQHERWKAAFDLVRSRTPKAAEPELREIGYFLSWNPMAYECLSRDFFIQSAKSQPALAGACLERLAGCRDWDALLAVANGRDIDFRLTVLGFFCVDPWTGTAPRSFRTTYDQGQLEFWNNCIRDSPWKSVETMAGALRTTEGYYLEPRQWLVLWEEAEAFANKGEKEAWPDDGGKFRNGLRLSAKIFGRDLVPKSRHILHRWRKLGSIRPEGETDEQHLRRLEIAGAARRQLLIAGWDPEKDGDN